MQHSNPFAAYGEQQARAASQRMSEAEARIAIIGAMEAAGMKPLDSIAGRLGDKLIRFRCEGDKHKANGWAVLHLDGRPAGAFGNYKLGISEKWKAEGEAPRLSIAERRERQRQWREQAEAREQERVVTQEAAACRCGADWTQAGAVDPSHPYLVAKGVAGEGLRQSGHWLLVPMHDDAGRLWNIQRIGPDGTKRFAKGGRQEGLFCLLGQPGDRLCIGEGYGTAAVVRRATGDAVVAAFSSANMARVAQSCRALFPSIDLVILADDDPHLIDHPHIRKNLGLIAAQEAAALVGGRVALPPRTVSI